MLDLKSSYGIVYGHETIKFQQGGRDYDAQHRQIKPAPVDPVKVDPKTEKFVLETDKLANAKSFLLQILKENPLSKSAIFKEVENNNQVWNDVRDAALELQIAKYSQKNLEMWKLPEGAQ
jgi:hypothetical protein